MTQTEHIYSLIDNAKKGKIVVSKDLFEGNVVLSTASLYTEKFHVLVARQEQCEISIILEKKDNSPITENNLRDFMNELIDNQTRFYLQKEFGSLRETIVNHAFSAVKRL